MCANYFSFTYSLDFESMDVSKSVEEILGRLNTMVGLTKVGSPSFFCFLFITSIFLLLTHPG
jgi:hypothetical protein